MQQGMANACFKYGYTTEYLFYLQTSGKTASGLQGKRDQFTGTFSQSGFDGFFRSSGQCWPTAEINAAL